MFVPNLSIVSIGVSVLSMLYATAAYCRLSRMIRSDAEATPRLIREAIADSEFRVHTAEGVVRKGMMFDIIDRIAHVAEDSEQLLKYHLLESEIPAPKPRRKK